MASPGGVFSDEEVAISPVLESTVAESGTDMYRALLPDFSAISADHEQVRGSELRNESLCDQCLGESNIEIFLLATIGIQPQMCRPYIQFAAVLLCSFFHWVLWAVVTLATVSLDLLTH